MSINDNQIIAQDSVWSQIAPNLYKYAKPILTYTDFYWRRGRFKKERIEYTKCLITFFKKSGEYWMYTGHIPRLTNELKEKGIKYELISKIRSVEFDPPHIEGITFREDQNKILETAIEQGRGVIVSATRTGKSILFRGLVQAFNQEKILFLVHTRDLVEQMIDDIGQEVDSLGEWTGRKKVKARVMISTIQTFHKIVKDWVHYFDVVFVDESIEGNQKITTDQGSIPIKDIVENKKDVKILSWNEKTNSVEWKNIKKYHKHSPKSKMLEITINGKTLKVTEEHKVYTSNRGWICAKDLSVNDTMMLTGCLL